jgi:septal ring factor EnvC (AmiA/AmiB activator)
LSGNSRFSNAAFGFNKSEVEGYIKDLVSEHEKALTEKDKIINELKKDNEKLKKDYQSIKETEKEILDNKEKIAEALVTAREQAKIIIKEAKEEAENEKKALENMIENEKEKLIDIKKETGKLKEEALHTISRYDDIMKKMFIETDIKPEKDEKTSE